MTLKTLWQAWRKFWFEPQSITPLALYRILLNMLILQSLLVHIGTDFLTWYGPRAISPLEAIQQYFWVGEPRFDVMLSLPQEDGWYVGYYISLVIATICGVLGLFTRYSTLYVCLGLISFHHHMPFNINGGDTFLRLTSIFLAASPCGEAWSLDNVIKRRRGIPITKLHNPWALRMIQLQLAIAYCDTFWCKIIGVQWLDGTAVYFATRLDDLLKVDIPFLFDNLFYCKLLSWGTLIIEFAMWTFVWFKDLRYYVLLSALCLHLGIDLTINLPVFEWAFIFCLVTFIEPQDLEWFADLVKSEVIRLLSRFKTAPKTLS